MLSYEHIPLSNVTLKSKLNEIPFPFTVAQAPFAAKSFPQETPIQVAMEMEQWLTTSIQKLKAESVVSIGQQY